MPVKASDCGIDGPSTELKIEIQHLLALIITVHPEYPQLHDNLAVLRSQNGCKEVRRAGAVEDITVQQVSTLCIEPTDVVTGLAR